MDPSEDVDADVELMEAAYGNDFKRLESYNDGSVRFSVKLASEGALVMVTFSLALDFPHTPMHCTVDGTLPIIALYELNKAVKSKIEDDPTIRSMEVCQCVSDFVSVWEVEHSRVETTSVHKPSELKIARFLIYFHHIMSSTKRKAIVDNAEELQLGGISKTGFPGVVIVEGQLENVLEYVRRIQRLRWQQMVVRGEEIELIEPHSSARGSIGSTVNQYVGGNDIGERSTVPLESKGVKETERLIDASRKLPKHFRELPTTNEGGGMSAVGLFCKDCYIHALFMTAMKKYDTNS